MKNGETRTDLLNKYMNNFNFREEERVHFTFHELSVRNLRSPPQTPNFLTEPRESLYSWGVVSGFTNITL